MPGFVIFACKTNSPENNSNESNPTNSRKSDYSTENLQVEWTLLESLGVDEADEDWDTVGYVQSDCGDGGSGCESD